MKAVIIGANGQLGQALEERFPDATALYQRQLDITDAATVEAFDWGSYDVILNAAAYTNVDGAETTPGRLLAWSTNASAVANLSAVATQHKLTLVHVSSDYVFDGQEKLHSENEPLSPLSVYGQSKAAGDLAASVTPKHYVLRTAWLIGNGANFVRTMMALADKNVSPLVVSDQVGRLTFIDQLVDGIEHLLKTKAPYGVYNLTNDGEPASWADITREIFRDLDRDDLTVTDQTTAEYFATKPGAAPRPAWSIMDLTKIQATGLKLRDWREDLKRYLADSH